MVALFPYTDRKKKNLLGTESLNEDNLVCKAFQNIKKRYKNKIGVMCDVALVGRKSAQLLPQSEQIRGWYLVLRRRARRLRLVRTDRFCRRYRRRRRRRRARGCAFRPSTAPTSARFVQPRRRRTTRRRKGRRRLRHRRGGSVFTRRRRH